MCPRLVFTGKVQIDIRGFVTVETNKCFKWYIKSIAIHIYAALGTNSRRKVDPNFRINTIQRLRAGITSIVIMKKLGKRALRAGIVRRQAVYFSNTTQISNKT